MNWRRTGKSVFVIAAVVVDFLPLLRKGHHFAGGDD